MRHKKSSMLNEASTAMGMGTYQKSASSCPKSSSSTSIVEKIITLPIKQQQVKTKFVYFAVPRYYVRKTLCIVYVHCTMYRTEGYIHMEVTGLIGSLFIKNWQPLIQNVEKKKLNKFNFRIVGTFGRIVRHRFGRYEEN